MPPKIITPNVFAFVAKDIHGKLLFTLANGSSIAISADYIDGVVHDPKEDTVTLHLKNGKQHWIDLAWFESLLERQRLCS